MQITSFYPMIVTSDVEGTVKKFEELGFEIRHRNESDGYSLVVIEHIRKEDR